MRYLILMVLVLCGCTTPYTPDGLTGGFKERKISDDRYIVSFFGNANTKEAIVWNFWIYRCAELTVSKGYDLFTIEPSKEHALLSDPEREKLVSFSMLAANNDVPRRVPAYFIYIPGGTISTYSSKGVVNMFKLPLADNVNADRLLDARTLMKNLKPYVDSNGTIEPIDRKALLIRSAVEAKIKANMLSDEDAKQLRQKAGISDI
ncbi:hypothetical protein HQ393_13855 [Chitinibacter bivalviorum]|uniref:Lipoprotein n=1 Tax=Chitinibacter bivalviorum TaxID=2739434 RepID=A0A7H9BKN2_9NEIS|nr:hypothetical protein [Chitinibacter bivalviorum]QLG89237.1 hypothetical protein HQ393_13855 [Chitinibacter bivalviorum]